MRLDLTECLLLWEKAEHVQSLTRGLLLDLINNVMRSAFRRYFLIFWVAAPSYFFYDREEEFVGIVGGWLQNIAVYGDIERPFWIHDEDDGCHPNSTCGIRQSRHDVGTWFFLPTTRIDQDEGVFIEKITPPAMLCWEENKKYFGVRSTGDLYRCSAGWFFCTSFVLDSRLSGMILGWMYMKCFRDCLQNYGSIFCLIGWKLRHKNSDWFA